MAELHYMPWALVLLLVDATLLVDVTQTLRLRVGFALVQCRHWHPQQDSHEFLLEQN